MDNLPWTKKRFRKSDRQFRPHCGRNRIKIIVCWPYLSKTCYWGTSWVTLSDIFIDSVRAHTFLLLFLQYCQKSNSPYLLHQKRQPTKWLTLIEWDELSSSMVMLLFFLSNNLFFFHLLGNFLYVVCCILMIGLRRKRKMKMTENDHDRKWPGKLSVHNKNAPPRYIIRWSGSRIHLVYLKN